MRVSTTETLDKAYLEYSNLTSVVTRKEILLQQTIQDLEAKLAKAVEAFVEIRQYNGDTTKVENIIRKNFAELEKGERGEI